MSGVADYGYRTRHWTRRTVILTYVVGVSTRRSTVIDMSCKQLSGEYSCVPGCEMI